MVNKGILEVFDFTIRNCAGFVLDYKTTKSHKLGSWLTCERHYFSSFHENPYMYVKVVKIDYWMLNKTPHMFDVITYTLSLKGLFVGYLCTLSRKGLSEDN